MGKPFLFLQPAYYTAEGEFLKLLASLLLVSQGRKCQVSVKKESRQKLYEGAFPPGRTRSLKFFQKRLS